MVRKIQAGPAMPVVVVGTDPGTTEGVSTTAVTTSVSQLDFNPSGAHSSDLAIATAQTLTKPTGATKLMIQALSQNVRYTLDGTAPTASSGFQLRAGDPPVIIPIGSNTVIKVIQEATTASLQYQWGA